MAMSAWTGWASRADAGAGGKPVSPPGTRRDLPGRRDPFTDGDSLWVRPLAGGAPRELRLRDIDAPEICQAFGEQSRHALAARVLHRQVTVRTRARDNYQRALAQVSLGHEDVAAWMVGHGYAWSYRYRGRAGPLRAHEAQARDARLGLWASSRPVEPRIFRKQHGPCK